MGLNGPVYQADLEFLGASPGNGRISSSDYPATPIFDHYSTSQRREHHGNHDAPYGDGRLSSADYPVTLFDSPHTLPPEDSSSTLSNRSTAREAEISNLVPELSSINNTQKGSQEGKREVSL